MSFFFGPGPRRRPRAAAARRPIFLATAAGAPFALFLALWLWPMDTSSFNRFDASNEMHDHDGRMLHAFLNDDEQWRFVRSLDAISPYLIDATLAAEDRRFYEHWGVDPLALARAALQNLTGRRVVSGASTLTMQVAKMGSPDSATSRTLTVKVGETLRALRLEGRLSKTQILEAYFNTAPYGGNLIGCEAAARRYFGKPARELTLAEAALLAGLPKSPTRMHPLRHPERALARRAYVLGRMRDDGRISDAQFRRAMDAPLGAAWQSLPTLAPHVAMRHRPAIRAAGTLRTTLDADIQARAERQVRRHVAALAPGVTNGAAIVVDARNAHILAWVGSADFFETPGGGQVDVCLAARSPGSALKPFLYGLAMERQRLYPTEALLDAPLDYGRYDPENFDRRFRGLVSATDALRWSLNVPAVQVLERIGYGQAWTFLTEMGLTTLTRNPDHYGLGLILGSCEVRLSELTAGYAALATGGVARPLRLVADANVRDDKAPQQRLFSEGVALALATMLEQPFPGEISGAGTGAQGAPPPVSWKTGTSNGYRDAWTFAYNGHYVVGVWMGNNDGSGSDRLVGVDAATPLAADVFRALPPRPGSPRPATYRTMRPVEICALSGLPAGRWCPGRRTALVPTSQYLHRQCAVHYPAGGDAAPTDGGDGRGGTPAVAARWPGSARSWDLASIDVVPSPATGGARPAATRHERALRILEPTHNAEYIHTGRAGGDRVRLRSSLDGRDPVYWYLNDRYLGATDAENPLVLQLTPGEHQLSCMSPQGATDQIRFSVVAPGQRR